MDKFFYKPVKAKNKKEFSENKKKDEK